MPLLEGTDGVKKMSKSYKNCIILNDLPEDMFGKIMSISDDLMYRYYELLTQTDLNIIKSMHPKEAKSALAREIVERYHGKEEALKAEKKFDKVFSKKSIPDNIGEYRTKDEEIKLSDLLVRSGMISSRNEAKRIIEQGGVKIDSQKAVGDFVIKFENSFVLQVGKRKFNRIIGKKN
jgi:tyrosyl-tRNA synthetase